MKDLIIFVFDSKDLCLKNEGKILLLDKKKNWEQAHGLVPGQEYILENPTVRELEKCRIVTGGTFINTAYLEAVKENYDIAIRLSDTDGEPGIRVAYDMVTKYKGQTIKEKGVLEPFLSWKDCHKYEGDPLYCEFFMFYSGVRERGNVTFLAIATKNHKETLKDFLEKREYQKISSCRDDDCLSINGSDRVINLVYRTETIYKRIGVNGETVSVMGEQEIPVTEAGIPYEVNVVAESPHVQQITVRLPGKSEGWLSSEKKFHFPGRGRGTFIDYARKTGWVNSPPATLEPEDYQWIKAGGRMFFSLKSSEASGGGFGFGWDGDYNILDAMPEIKKVAITDPDPSRGDVKLKYKTGVVYLRETPYLPDYEHLLQAAVHRTDERDKLIKRRGEFRHSDEIEKEILSSHFETQKTIEDPLYKIGVWEFGNERPYSNRNGYGPIQREIIFPEAKFFSEQGFPKERIPCSELEFYLLEGEWHVRAAFSEHLRLHMETVQILVDLVEDLKGGYHYNETGTVFITGVKSLLANLVNKDQEVSQKDLEEFKDQAQKLKREIFEFDE